MSKILLYPLNLIAIVVDKLNTIIHTSLRMMKMLWLRVRRAIERLLKQERDSSAVKDYVRGYREVPESAKEVEAIHQVGIAVLAEEPWA